VEQRIREEQSRRKRDDLEKGWRAEQKAAVAAGAKPFYLKKSEKRKRELVAKYEELKAAGQLDKFMAKRRKKNSAKDHRYVPSRRTE
jgi:ribosomal RNA-processing protein 36